MSLLTFSESGVTQTSRATFDIPGPLLRRTLLSGNVGVVSVRQYEPPYVHSTRSTRSVRRTSKHLLRRLLRVPPRPTTTVTCFSYSEWISLATLWTEQTTVAERTDYRNRVSGSDVQPLQVPLSSFVCRGRRQTTTRPLIVSTRRSRVSKKM